MYQCTTNYLYYLPLSNKFNNIQLMNMFHGWKYWCLIVYYPKTSLSPWNTHCVGYRLKTWHLWLLEEYGMEDREDREVIINPPIYPKQEVAGGIRVFEPSVRPFVRPKVCQSNFLEPRLIFNRYYFVNLTWYLGHNM